MTIEEFEELYLGKAVHCDTKEKTNEFLALADSGLVNKIDRRGIKNE